MLNFIYYPVSFILWCWHWVFGHLLGPTSAVGWALSIVFLVFTLRMILLKPAISQVRSMRKMQQFAPEIKKIQKKYANDRQKQAQEMQRLQREHGVNPLGGCLPALLQIPVFIGLNHVLRSFSPHSSQNYFFGPADVHSYLSAKLLGANLDSAILGIGSMGGTPGWHWSVAPVAIPLMIAAAVATHFTARLSARRQQALGTTTAQAELMSKITVWIFPLGVLVFGGALPIGLLLYWLSNNVWTLAQQHFVMERMDREEEQKRVQAEEQRQALAPRPGQKPTQPKNRRPAVGTQQRPGQPAGTDDEPSENGTSRGPNRSTTSGTANKPQPGAKPRPGAKPQPGAKPKPPVKPKPPAKAGAADGTGTTGRTDRSASSGRKQPTRGGSGGQQSSGGQQRKSNGQSNAAPEIPGLIADRSRRKKQDRKR